MAAVSCAGVKQAYSASGWTTVSTSVMGFLSCWTRARCRSLRGYQMLKDRKQLHIRPTVLRKEKKKKVTVDCEEEAMNI